MYPTMKTHQAEVAREMKAFANVIAARAATLVEYADSLAGMDEEAFAHHIGDKHAASGWFTQIKEQVDEVAHVRSNDLYNLDRVMLLALVAAQRDSAQKES